MLFFYYKRLLRFLQLKSCSDPTLREYFSASSPSIYALIKNTPFLIVDLETTGLNSSDSEIASIGWVVLEHGLIKLSSAEHHLVRVKQGVGQSAVFHQIHDDDLLKAESIKDIMNRFLHVAAGKILVFHNAKLDMDFIDTYFLKSQGTRLYSVVVDTLQLEKHKLHRSHQVIEDGALRLFACRQRYGLPDYPAHDALVDAIATAELFTAQLQYRGANTRLSEIV